MSYKKIIFIFCFVLYCVFSSNVNAQSQYNIINIQNHRNDIAVSIKQHTHSAYTLSSYGKILNLIGSDINANIFQGQKFDSDLGLYLFPSRLYSAKERRFFQPDPKSQYHSPYLFVDADPVNKVDRDGNEGKPLVLYQEDHNFPNGINPGTLDLQSAVPDAHYVPLSDFINGNVGDLPEWNGNVFFRGHIGVNVQGRELIAEAGTDVSKLKTRMMPGVHAPQFIQDYGTNVVTMDAKEMGRVLRRFSDSRGVPIKNVTEGGCVGTYATKPMHQGFMEESKRFGKMKRKIKFRGAKGKYEARFTGDHTFKSMRFSNYPKETRFYLSPHGAKPGLPFVHKNFEKRFVGFTHSTNGGASYKPDFFMGEDGVRSMVNGEFTRKAKSYFSKITDIY